MDSRAICRVGMNSQSASTDAMSILILNEDCFLELFKYLDLFDLFAVADVCSRLRQHAIAFYGYAKRSDFYSIEDTLPLWPPEVGDLEFSLRSRRNKHEEGLVFCFDGSHQPLKKLVKVAVYYGDDLRIDKHPGCERELFKAHISIERRCRQLLDRLFRTAGNHFSDIETLQMSNVFLCMKMPEYLSQFKNLRVLDFLYDGLESLSGIKRALRHLGSANTLKSLTLQEVFGGSEIEFFEELLNFKKLEKLTLRGLSVSRSLENIGSYISELRMLHLHSSFYFDDTLISKIIQSAGKLKVLSIMPWDRRIVMVFGLDVDVNIHKKWLDIVESRHNRTPLRMILSERFYTTSMSPSPARLVDGNIIFDFSLV